MTDEQINQRIAEACGWTEKPRRMPDGFWYYGRCPDYCTNLNAMHEAEKVLHPSQPTSMRHWLEVLCKKRKLGNFWQAPARERAEAFLRVLDRWEEVQG